MKKKAYIDLRGYDELQTGTEDYDLPQRLKYKYGINSILRINSFIFHNEGRLLLFNTLKKKLSYAKTIDNYKKIRSNENYFRKQSSIIERCKLFFSSPNKLFQNPIYGFGMLFMKIFEFGFGFVGYLLNLNKQIWKIF